MCNDISKQLPQDSKEAIRHILYSLISGIDELLFLSPEKGVKLAKELMDEGHKALLLLNHVNNK